MPRPWRCGKGNGPAELDSLTNLVNNHLVSSVGDRAADRLGDLVFRARRLREGRWRMAIGAGLLP